MPATSTAMTTLVRKALNFGQPFPLPDEDGTRDHAALRRAFRMVTSPFLFGFRHCDLDFDMVATFVFRARAERRACPTLILVPQAGEEREQGARGAADGVCAYRANWSAMRLPVDAPAGAPPP